MRITSNILLLLLLLGAPITSAFVPQHQLPATRRTKIVGGLLTIRSSGVVLPTFRHGSSTRRALLQLRLSSGSNDDDGETSKTTLATTSTRPMSPTEIIIEKRLNPNFVPPSTDPKQQSELEKKYPLDLPSPLLLATSIFLAIVSTGSIYQLANHQTTPGDLTPVAIAVIGVPTGMFLFYAAITKAMVETEEDDKKFLAGK